MKRSAWIALITATIAAAGLGAAARAQEPVDCLSKCNDAYQDAVANCQKQYGDPDKEVQLQECMDAAQTTLGQCTDACDAEE